MILYHTCNLPKCFLGKRKQHCFIQKFKIICTFSLDLHRIYSTNLNILTFCVKRRSYGFLF